jgi:hypothetical protein
VVNLETCNCEVVSKDELKKVREQAELGKHINRYVAIRYSDRKDLFIAHQRARVEEPRYRGRKLRLGAGMTSRFHRVQELHWEVRLSPVASHLRSVRTEPCLSPLFGIATGLLGNATKQLAHC